MDAKTLERRMVRATFASRALLLVVVALLGGVFWLLVSVVTDTNHIVTQVEDQQDMHSNRLDAATMTLDRVTDCTTPGGKCFDEGAERTADAVGNIGRLSVYAAACAADERVPGLTLAERASRIERCVTRLVDHRES